MASDSSQQHEPTPADIETGPAFQQPSRVRWILFSLWFGTSWMLYLHRYTFAPIKPKLVEEWEIGKEDLG